ncbi:MAG: heterodisulfide reductase subunit C [Candidatus Schekmanbacteria bacterium]|nr:MAG: heterodisulfide reductase subunit C [Candidatus Schekmanbacteria bacterium]
MSEITLENKTKEFRELIEKISRQNVNACYQCLKCSAGCPMADEMDYTPAQIIHAIRLGLEDYVITSGTIWVCVSCETCSTRCPQGVDIAHIMDAARNIAYRRGINPPAESREISDFYTVALNNIRAYGRMYELGLVLGHKIKTGDYFKDMKLGMKMGLKGKLKLLPARIRNVKAIDKIFKKVSEIEEKEKV